MKTASYFPWQAHSLLLTIYSIGIPWEVWAWLDAGETLANTNYLLPSPCAGDLVLLCIDVQVPQTSSQWLNLLEPKREGEELGLCLWRRNVMSCGMLVRDWLLLFLVTVWNECDNDEVGRKHKNLGYVCAFYLTDPWDAREKFLLY